MKLVLLLMCIGISKTVFSQTKEELLQQTYYNKVHPVSITSKSDVLYNGIDNYIKLKFPDSTSQKLNYFLKIHNGVIVDDDSLYLVVPRFTGRAFITTFMVTEKNDTLLFGRKEFKVVNIPSPTVKLGNVIIVENCSVHKDMFNNKDTLKVYFTEDIPNSDQWCQIKYFNVGYHFGNNYVSMDNEGPLFTSNTIDFIKNIRSGQEIFIKVNNVSPSRIIKNLPLVRFSIR